MRSFLVALSLLIYFSSNLEASWEEVAEYARDHLPLKGQLMAKTGTNGYLYLKVDAAYGNTLFHLLEIEAEGYEKYVSQAADIRVTSGNELILPTEIGQIFYFEVDKFDIIERSKINWDIVLKITSSDLDKFRKKYGLPPKEYYMLIANKNYYSYFSMQGQIEDLSALRDIKDTDKLI